MIDQCEEFHNKVIQMLTQGTLRIEEATSKIASNGSYKRNL